MRHVLAVHAPIRDWLTDDIPDRYLQGPLARARAEFRGATDADVKALWARLESVLRGCSFAANYDAKKKKDIVHDGSQAQQVDLFRLFWLALRYREGQGYYRISWSFLGVIRRHTLAIREAHEDPAKRKLRYQPLLVFLDQLSTDPIVAVGKAMALFVMRELGSQNPEGAVRAATVLSTIDAEWRPRVDEVTKLHQARSDGGKKTALHQGEKTRQRRKGITEAWVKLREAGRPQRERAGIIAKQYGMTPHAVRRVLKQSATPIETVKE